MSKTKKNDGPLCVWTVQIDGEFHESDCGHAFTFETDGAVANGFKFCPYCGLRLKEKQL